MAQPREGWAASPIADEFSRSEVGDVRLERRLGVIAETLIEKPAVGFPQVFESDAELEAFYRFLNNDRVDEGAVLAGHVQATLERATVEKTCLVVHDTTEFIFGGTKRKGSFREPHGCSLRTSVRRIEVEAAAVEVDRRLEVLDVAITAGALLDGLDGGVEPFADSVRDSMRVVRQDVV